ncbi:hypothetical protein EW026_g6315 [Hermanssonia centrifuga]|uniref:TEA domain-containing protein n=1 Tax=Hermanssonia centrifuga TaxID=98765 RepID=A0A4S4KBF9_9APHY|nr:hypothetical protein EW026_g6315 [Hermanssonia centrifuga]
MSSSRSFAQHVSISSLDDLTYTVPSASSSGTNDAIQTIVTGRKCWKTIKGKGEVVWPPYLEAALVEGLEKYRPVETRSARALGRFPMRNKFISDYILQTTGKHRTPKQVGSRLQQLRDTCEGKRILKLLSRRPGDPPRADDAPQSPEPSTSSIAPRDYVSIDVLPADAPWPSSSGSTSSFTSSLCSIPRPLYAIDPTVTFQSRSPITAYSFFRVLKNGAAVHEETSEMQMRSSSCRPSTSWTSEVECNFLYSTALVPRYWKFLCECKDVSSYIIEQDIVRSAHADRTDTRSLSPTNPEDIMFSVTYRFNSNHSSAPQSPISSNGDTYSVESSPELGPEFDTVPMLNPYDASASLISRPYPQSSQRQYQQYHQQPSHRRDAFELPPGLIHAGEDGYASLPQSPLDMTFGGINASLGSSAGADPADSICRSYVDMDYSGACFDANVGVNVGPIGPGVVPGYNVAMSMAPYQTF